MTGNQDVIFVVYDPATGAILNWGSCPKSLAPLQGDHVIEATERVDYDRHHVVDGRVVERND